MGVFLKIYMMGCEENCSNKLVDVIYIFEVVRGVYEFVRFINVYYNYISIIIIRIFSLFDFLGSVYLLYFCIINILVFC